MAHTETATDASAEDVGSDARLSPEALSALAREARTRNESLEEEERLTADTDISKAVDEPVEADQLEDDARP